MEFVHSEHDMTSQETSYHAPEEESEDFVINTDTDNQLNFALKLLNG